MKHKIEMCVHWRTTSSGKEEFALWCTDMSKVGGYGVMVNKQAVEFDVPDDFDPTGKQIAALKEEEAELRKQFAMRLDSIKEQISKLQALTYEPEVV